MPSDEPGNIVVRRDGYRVIVESAPATAWAAPEIVREWWFGHECRDCGLLHHPRVPVVDVDRARRIVTFGTPGEGEGRVSYRVGEFPPDDEPSRLGEPLRTVLGPPARVLLTRVDGVSDA